MSRRKLSLCRKQSLQKSRRNRDRRCQRQVGSSKVELLELLNWVVPEGKLFSEDEFHGNVRWSPKQLCEQALLWSWQETKHVTSAFVQASEVCAGLGRSEIAQSYTSFMNALDRYSGVFSRRLRQQCQTLAMGIGDRFFRCGEWALIGFDGSRATAPRTVANEQAFCAPNYGHSGKAKTRAKRRANIPRCRRKSERQEPQEPQVWITMFWHMSLRLPWTWQLGPSYSSERDHVVEILEREEFPENTLFCGDAGFTGYPLWNAILQAGQDFIVRIGGNVRLLSRQANIKKLGGGLVLCWPKNKIANDEPPLRLRLVSVRIGKTKMWLLTSVLDARRLPRKQLAQIYRLRWGIEVEFRGLKQTIDKHTLRCRNNDRLLVELDWSLCGMAIAELLALRAQIHAAQNTRKNNYQPRDRSLANTLRALRNCLRRIPAPRDSTHTLSQDLSRAVVQKYRRRASQQARYRPKNPDIKPLRDPYVRKLNEPERRKLQEISQPTAA